jgi:hypothetical protein
MGLSAGWRKLPRAIGKHNYLYDSVTTARFNESTGRYSYDVTTCRHLLGKGLLPVKPL